LTYARPDQLEQIFIATRDDEAGIAGLHFDQRLEPLVYGTRDQVVSLKALHGPDREAVRLQRLDRQHNLVLQRGIGGRAVRLVGRVELTAEGAA
jgi:hypothetical protein